MEYKGKLYAKVGGKYIECTETVQQLESRIKELESEKSTEMIQECEFCNTSDRMGFIFCHNCGRKIIKK